MSNKPNTVDIQAINQNISEQLNNIKLPMKAEDFKAVADQELNMPINETMQVGLDAEAENTKENFSLTGSLMSLVKDPLVLILIINILMNRKVRRMILGMIPMTKDSESELLNNFVFSVIVAGVYIVLKKFI